MQLLLSEVIQNKKDGIHRFPLISSCTSKHVGRMWAGSKLQAVCKRIHCSKVSFSTFPAVVTRVPELKRLNSLLCLLHNLQNCKQRATRKAQILPLSTLTRPLPKRSLSSGSSLLVLSLSLQQLFANCRDPYLLCSYIQLSTSTRMYVLSWLPTFRPICSAGALPTEKLVGPFH